MFLSVLLVLLAGLVIVFVIRDLQRAHRLPALQAPATLIAQPLVSIVIPARNEANNIARCLDGALAQCYTPYEVVVVDDGSTDATPHILREYATRFPHKLTVVAGRPLPRGWVGKCNACLHGAHRAQGEWLLFLDADTAPQPDLIAALLAFAQQRHLDLVSVLPFNELGTWSEQLILPVFYQFALTAFPLQRNLSAEAPANNVLANGQCLLVRAEAYWALGGHEVVKDKVLEDIEFAQAMRRAGYRVGLATAFEHLRVRMYHNLCEVVQGLGKHAAAGRRASGWRAFWAILRMSLTLLAPWLLCAMALGRIAAYPSAWHGWVALFAGGAALGMTLRFWAKRYRRWYALPGWMAMLASFGWLVYLFIVMRGTLRVIFRRGVTWKERVYSS